MQNNTLFIITNWEEGSSKRKIFGDKIFEHNHFIAQFRFSVPVALNISIFKRSIFFLQYLRSDRIPNYLLVSVHTQIWTIPILKSSQFTYKFSMFAEVRIRGLITSLCEENVLSIPVWWLKLFIFSCESKSFAGRNYLFLMSHLLNVECGLQSYLDFLVSSIPEECPSLKQSLTLGGDGYPFCYKLLLSLIFGRLCLHMSNHQHSVLLVLLLAKFQPSWCSLLSSLFFPHGPGEEANKTHKCYGLQNENRILKL